MPRTRIAHTLDVWEKLTQGVAEAEEIKDAPELQLFHQQLQGHLAEIQKLFLEQSYHEAAKQKATQRINEILEDGRRTATALKVGLQCRYGNRSPHLVRFGIRPFHRRKRQPAEGPAPDGETSS